MDLKIIKSAATDVTVSVNSTEVTVQKSSNVVVEVTPQKAETITIDRGVQGAQGEPGVGVPAGGTTGQVLAKASGSNYDTTWSNAGSGSVTSVAVTGGTTGLTTTGSPITTSGTIALGGTLALANGGTGATTASGARTNLSAAINGANNDITSMSAITGGIDTPDYLQLDTAAAASIAVAKLRWNATTATAAFGIVDGTDEVNIGEQMFAYVTNAESVAITRGQPVYLYQATGNRATVKLAYNTSDATSAKTLGLVAQDSIGANQTGFVITQGVVSKFDTSAFAEGATLYLGATAGTLTATKPKAPNHLVYIGVVERSNAGNGQIYVRPQNGYELDEIHDVQINSPANGQTIIYDATASLWKNANLTAGTGVSVTNGASSITLTNTAPDQVVSLTGAGTTTVTGTYPSFTITSTGGSGGGTVTSVGGTGSVNGITLTGTVTSSGNLTLGGTLGSIANSQLTNSSITINGTAVSLGGSITTPSGTVTSVTGTAPVVSSGGATPAISMAAATSLVSGYLTSTDWSTFNGKYSTGGALGTPASGTLTNCTGYTYANLSGTVPTWNQNTTGNAATVTNGVYTTGSYSNPAWITSISGSIVSGAVASATTAGSATTATSATSATTSTNIAGGTATQIPYQTSASTTGFIAAPSTASYLQWNGTSYTWSNPSGAGTVSSVDLSMPSGFSVSGNPITSSGTLAVTTSLSGILKGNGTGFTTATSGTDYAPATSGTSILYGNGSGGFSNVTIGSGLSFSTGTLTATGGGGGTPAGANTQVQYNNSGAFGASSSFTFDGVNVTSPEFTATASTSASSTNGAFAYGTLGYSDTDVMASFQSSVNSYNQVVLQNTNAGASASTNFNVSNNNGTATTNYGELGINSSGFSGTGSFGAAGNVYLSSASTDLAIGTYGANAIHFVTNSGATDAGSISSAGKWAINASSTNTTATALLHLGAGTATANTAPLKLTSGTNLTTAEAGAIEYDGQLKYFTPTGTARALTQNSYYYRKNTATTLSSATGNQSIFALTNGVIVAANTIYEVECEFELSTSGTTSHTEAFGFTLATATVTNMGVAVNRLSGSTTSSALGAYLTTVTPVVVTGSLTTAQTGVYRVKGTIAFGTGGSFNPVVAFSAAPGGTSSILLGSWMKVTPIGTTGSNVSIGTWA
ncbi:hypothetical protein UFOVP17_22 [uncultured Caudovirales phage]|uniref:Uncharacterized protein n=1 Tax=uncultured Caudovirales phage TaxID=2100421 RepID=A0A6J5KL55_9CAUD|nr:hypothetical protein UFOVP17_22 [uncultured Caudovirales phage]